MSSPPPSGCPECDIIILSYAKVPAAASKVIWNCEAIEALYGTSSVQAKVASNPALHQANLDKLNKILKRQEEDAKTLEDIIKDITS